MIKRGRPKEQKLGRGRPTDSDLRICDYIYALRVQDGLYRLCEGFFFLVIYDVIELDKWRKQIWKPDKRILQFAKGYFHNSKTFRLLDAMHFTGVSKSALYRVKDMLEEEGIIHKTKERGVYTVIDDMKFQAYMEKRIREMPLFRYPILLKSACCALPTCSVCMKYIKKELKKARQQHKKHRKYYTLMEQIEDSIKRLESNVQKWYLDIEGYYCPECKSHGIRTFFKDMETGEIICRKCGLIIDVLI